MRELKRPRKSEVAGHEAAAASILDEGFLVREVPFVEEYREVVPVDAQLEPELVRRFDLAAAQESQRIFHEVWRAEGQRGDQEERRRSTGIFHNRLLREELTAPAPGRDRCDRCSSTAWCWCPGRTTT
jgi:hypothetical protein